MPERPNFGERFRQIQSELTKTPEQPQPQAGVVETKTQAAEIAPTESPVALREKLLRYRQLQHEQEGFSSEAANITSQLQEGEQFLSDQVAAVADTPEKAKAVEELQALLQEMRAEMEKIQTEQQAREELVKELMSPAFEKFLEQAANAETASRENIDQLKELLSKEGESLHPVYRLELLGRLYGLQPTPENKDALADALSAMAKEHRYYGNIGSDNAARDALLKTIELSDRPLPIKDLIEMVRPTAGQGETVESLYTYSRDAVYKALAEKTIRHAIAQGNAEEAEKTLVDEATEMGQHRDKLWHGDVAKFQQQIIELYLKAGNVDGARKFVASEGFGGDRDFAGRNKLDAYIAIFKVSGDAADVAKARGMRVYDSLYSETEKWQKIGEASGEKGDIDKANQAVLEMSRRGNYPTESVFSFDSRMYGLPGIDKQQIEQILREKAKPMSQLDRAKAYLTIAGMTKKAEDEAVLRKELEDVSVSDRQFDKGTKSEMFTGQEYISDSASAYGYLLRDFLDYVSADPSRVTPQNRQIAERLLDRFEKAYPSAKNNQNSRATSMFWGDVDGAKERVAALFQTPEQFKAELARTDIGDVHKKGWIRIQYYGRRSSKEKDQQALEAVVDAIKQKAKDPKELSNYLGDFTWRYASQARDEQDLRFLQRVIETNTTPEVTPAYDNVVELMHAGLARATAETSEADQHIQAIRDSYRKGRVISDVAKLRRDLSKVAA